LTFSPDGQKVAYEARSGGKEFIVIGEEEGKRYDYVYIPIFSPGSQKVGYVARQEGDATEARRWFVVVDGKESKYHNVIGNPIFSSDSKYMSYGVHSERELWWVVEEVE
jgi:hypothetical protein